CARRSFDFW
nr:immunoglobulin heavy chain junction region [Mus musculus]MBK4187289.1 immunoglobulin heavy chain junction region [Mus musculus]